MNENQIILILIILIFSYLIGSIPTAFILVKKLANKDITKEGSGNVGAMNSYEVTKSRKIGFLVLFFDFLKGFIPVLFVKTFFAPTFELVALVSLIAVLGHCYPIWNKFIGGKGLATALGTSVLFVPFIPVIWCITWVFLYRIFESIHKANILASIVVIFLSVIFQSNVINFTFPKASNLFVFYLFIFLFMGLIIFRHKQHFNEFKIKH